MRVGTGAVPVVDFYHNRFARIPIPRERAAPLVTSQIEAGTEPPVLEGPSIFDIMRSREWSEWLADPEGKFKREIENCLRQLRVETGTHDS